MHLFIYVSLMKSHLIKHKHQVAKENLVLKKITASNKQIMRRRFDLLSFGFQWSSSRALQEKQVTKHTEAYQISTFTLSLVLTVTSELFDYDIPNAQHCWGRWRRQSPADTQRDRRIAIERPPSPFKETLNALAANSDHLPKKCLVKEHTEAEAHCIPALHVKATNHPQITARCPLGW